MSEAAGQPLPEHIEPMLATLGELPALKAQDQFGYEMKWDGVRAMVRVSAGKVGLTSRNNIDMTVAYPEIAGLGAQLAGRQAFLDGEIVTFDRNGKPSFGLLQKRMHVSGANAAKALARSDPAVLLLFDVLHLDGRSLLATPYRERRELLEGLQLGGSGWETPPAFDGSGTEAVAVSKEQQLEGVVAKRLTSRYLPGRRSPDWIKIKNVRTQEVIVGGWRTGAGSRAGTIGALLLGLPEAGGLRYIGRVGTGFNAAMLADLTDRFRASARDTTPFSDVPRVDAKDAHWVQPDLVGEVAFAEWTSEGRLRHPAWRGLRPDKRPDEVVKES
jgi:bifunctional non-homologous end joining protein LigD